MKYVINACFKENLCHEVMYNGRRSEKALDDIRPNLQADGGDVELVNISEDGIVSVKLKGAARGAPCRR